MARKKKQMDKLAWENSLALAAGMSYGKWKAMQSPVQIVKQDVVPEGWLVCENCGKAYKPKTKRPQRFCDYTCQEKAYHRNNRKMLNARAKERREREKEKRNEAESNG